MNNIEEKKRCKIIFLFILYYFFVLSFFINQLFPHRFNSVIFLLLIPLVFKENIINLNRYFALTSYFLINVIVLVCYIFELSTVINLLQVLVATFFFACLAYTISINFSIDEFIKILTKNFTIILFTTIILTTFLTFVQNPLIINYFFWETLSSSTDAKVFKLLSGGGTGHSSANIILPILFSLMQYNFFKKNKDERLLSFFLMILFAFFAYLTKSRTTYFLIILLSLSSFTYLNFFWFKKYFKIFIIITAFLFLSMSSKPTYSYLAYEVKILNFILSLDAFTTVESKIATPEKFFASRDFLNQRLLNEISKNPFIGIGHTDDLFTYGVTNDLSTAYNLKRSAGSESILIIPAKYGLPYFFFLMFFIVSIPFSFHNLKKNELALFQNFWTIIFITVMSSGGLLSMYGTSGFLFLLLSLLYFFSKSKKIYS